MAQTELPPNVLEVLDGMIFPATVVELVAYAEDHDASEEVLDLIQAMPDRVYNNIQDVAVHMGQIEPLPALDENLWASAPSEDLFSAREEPVDTAHSRK